MPVTSLNPTISNSSESRHCRLCIGDASVVINAESPEDLRLSKDHEAFKVGDTDRGEIELSIKWVDALRSMSGNTLFDSGALWKLHEGSTNLVFDFAVPIFGKQPYKRLLVDRRFSRAELLVNRHVSRRGFDLAPLEEPVDELLFTHWLADGHGAEIHGCGLVDSEIGSILFVGHSGAGKSTTTRLWSSQRSVRVLSDDRIILRKQGKQLSMYGTPWRGEAGFASPEKAGLHRIFVISHGERNEIVPLGRSQAIAELFARCCVPFYDPRAIEFTLSFLHEITNVLPCYLFRFRPEASAVEKILDFHD